MDYKKKLALAKEALDSGSYDKETIEYIFPELAESEDERIRKELMNIINLSYDCGIAITKESRDRCIAWLEKQDKQSSLQTNERAWIYLVSDVLTWKDGIGQYLDDPRVQEFAKKLCSEYAQKLYNFPLLSNSSNIGKNEQKYAYKVEPQFKVGDWITIKE